MSSDVDIRQQVNIRLEVNWYGFFSGRCQWRYLEISATVGQFMMPIFRFNRVYFFYPIKEFEKMFMAEYKIVIVEV